MLTGAPSQLNLSSRGNNKPAINLNKPEFEINTKTYFAYSPNFLMNKVLNTPHSSIFSTSTEKKKTPIKKKESNHLNYYKNYLSNTESFFSKDSSNGSRNEKNTRLMDYNNKELNYNQEKKLESKNLGFKTMKSKIKIRLFSYR